KVYDLTSLKITEEDIKNNAGLEIVRFAKPIREAKAEFLVGSPDEISERVAQLIKERGLI
ncbi:MAG: hypothetical protein ABIL00_06145, partial [candidate division WOR-3 bacterium]